MERRTYPISPIRINNTVYTEVIIDPHYEEKHAEHINDELILSLVMRLDGRNQLPEEVDDSFSYFVTIVELENKSYRLVWLLEENAIYIGVINAFRDKRGGA